MSSILPLSRVVAYSAAKAAVLNLTQFLGREWATKGVRVNAITPGFFPAEQNRRMLLKDDGTYTERGQAIIGHTPMGRFGDAPELGGAVVWLGVATSIVVRNRSEHRGGRRLLVDNDLAGQFEGTDTRSVPAGASGPDLRCPTTSIDCSGQTGGPSPRALFRWSAVLCFSVEAPSNTNDWLSVGVGQPGCSG